MEGEGTGRGRQKGKEGRVGASSCDSGADHVMCNVLL